MLYNNKLMIIANWKMNPINYQDTINLFNLYIDKLTFDTFNVIITPPIIYLLSLMEKLKRAQITKAQLATAMFLGSQDLSFAIQGAVTGDISVNMVKDLGVNFTILGHSERRQYYHESDQLIAKKFLQVLQADMIPIVCIGETKAQFNQGKQVVVNLLEQQLFSLIQQFNYLLEQDYSGNHTIFIAYEPIWAIGNGAPIDFDYIKHNIQHIKHTMDTLLKNLENLNNIKPGNYSKIKYYILYGGSVTANNVNHILKLPHIGGILVGGAALNFQEFQQLCCRC